MTIHQPWTVLSHQQILDNPHLKKRCEQVAVPNGPIIPDYYIIENRGWVAIVPITEYDHLLIKKQYQHGIRREELEFPAGGMHEHEDDPLLTAQRALMGEPGK